MQTTVIKPSDCVALGEPMLSCWCKYELEVLAYKLAVYLAENGNEWRDVSPDKLGLSRKSDIRRYPIVRKKLTTGDPENIRGVWRKL